MITAQEHVALKMAEIHGAAILYQICERHEKGRSFGACQADVIAEYDFASMTPLVRAMTREIAWGFTNADCDAETSRRFGDAVFDRNIRPLCKWPRLSRIIWPWTGIWF